MTRPLRLFLIMHSTRSDNLGVGALTAAQVEILRGVAARLGRALELTILDWKDPRPPYVLGDDIRILPLDMRFLVNPRGFFATVRAHDAVIDIGAGDSFADIYGTGRLRRMFLMKALVHLARRPLVVAPQTIGPFSRWSSRLLARLTLNRSAILATRDALSTAAVRDLGVRREVVQASDVALRLPYTPAPPHQGLLVGLNVSGLLMAGGYGGGNDYGIALDYPAAMRALIAQITASGATLYLTPHVIVKSGPMVKEDDLRASAALAAEFKGVHLAPDFADPVAAKSFISGMDLFIGARMHACIAALSSGVAVLPLAYSRKFAGLFGSIGYDRTLDLRSTGQAELLRAAADALADPGPLRDEARAATARGITALGQYESALVGLLQGARG